MRPYAVLPIVLLLAACAPGEEGSQPTVGARSEAQRDAGPHDSGAPVAADPGIAPAEPPTSPAPPATALAGDARFDGYRGLRLGMSVEDARAAWKGELGGDRIEPKGCGYLVPADVANGSEFGLMFEDGRLVRYDVGLARETAPGGGRVGMTQKDIERLYPGRVREQPHEYVPGGRYLRILDPASAQRALVFETDEAGRVTRWRAGQAPQVDYVEGCS